MPYTNRQIKRILADNILPKNTDLTLSQRVGEATVRRITDAIEDKAKKDMDSLFQSTWRNIRNGGMEVAENMGINGKLSTLNKGMRWRDTVADAIDDIIMGLWQSVDRNAYWQSPAAYQAGYFGRAWAIQVSMKPEAPRVPIEQINLSNDYVASRVSQEWQARYGDPFSLILQRPFLEFRIKARAALGSAVVNQETPMQALLRVKALMGVSKYDKLYFAAQINIRTLMEVGASLGTIQRYVEVAQVPIREAIGGIGGLVLFVTQGDGRVCSICRGYSGRMWRIDTLAGAIGAALTFPVPPVHHGCRCTEVLIPLPEWLLPPDVPPGMTFGEWLLLMGLGGILDTFMDGELDSSQIGDETYSEYYT